MFKLLPLLAVLSFSLSAQAQLAWPTQLTLYCGPVSTQNWEVYLLPVPIDPPGTGEVKNLGQTLKELFPFTSQPSGAFDTGIAIIRTDLDEPLSCVAVPDEEMTLAKYKTWILQVELSWYNDDFRSWAYLGGRQLPFQPPITEKDFKP